MLNKPLLKDYLEYLTDKINDQDFTDIDTFIDDHDLTDTEMDALMELDLEVVLRKDE